MSEAVLYRVTSPRFTAGFVLDKDGWVADCAPILRRWIKGRGLISIQALCRERGWQLELVL